MPSKEIFEDIELWPRLSRVLDRRHLTGERYPRKETKLIDFCYREAQQIYQKYPLRKNKEEAFLHPLNVAHYLMLAQADILTVCTGLWHDLLEEERDIYFEEEGSPGTSISDTGVLSRLQLNLEGKLETKLATLSLGYPAAEIMGGIILLTRHKKERYYKSISGIFNHPDQIIRERAMGVKLADRLHNILTVEIYPDEEKIYQCFKNLFILNNAKRYLMEKDEDGTNRRARNPVLEKLFKKCSKATYHTLFKISQELLQEPLLQEEAVYLRLALSKYIHEIGGLWQVTKPHHLPADEHPIRLYDGIVMKYSARLHEEKDEFAQLTQRGFDYCQRTFSRLHLAPEMVRLGMDYKDAIALMEVLARLIYKPDYYLKGFECSELCHRGRICEKEVKVS